VAANAEASGQQQTQLTGCQQLAAIPGFFTACAIGYIPSRAGYTTAPCQARSCLPETPRHTSRTISVPLSQLVSILHNVVDNDDVIHPEDMCLSSLCPVGRELDVPHAARLQQAALTCRPHSSQQPAGERRQQEVINGKSLSKSGMSM
jgi:hypothetical protein